MSASSREIGTLIVVVLKANHLPNKRHIGKQDPYCLVTVNGEKRRTKAIKRGGQHPEWDEEIRFTLYEDSGDVPSRIVNGNSSPPPPPPKDNKKPKKIQGGNTMKIACYADDPREPDLIGEADVDLTEVLTKGETDEWFDLTNKDKFAGKVYLELTFWSNEPPPEKKVTPKPSKGNKQYAGPGSFVAAGEQPSPSHGVGSLSRVDHPRQHSDAIPPSLRAANSFGSLDLYVAPYEQRHRSPVVDQLAQEFSEFGISSQRRSESLPPVQNVSMVNTIGHAPTPVATIGYAEDSALQSSFLPSSQGSGLVPAQPTSGYRPPYEAHLPSAYPAPPPSRGPRHSLPASSGFVPLPSSGFSPFPSHQVDNTYTPLSTSSSPYGAPQSQAPYVHPQQPSVLSTPGYGTQPPSTSFQTPPHSYQTSYHYHQPPGSVSAQSYISTQPQPTPSPQHFHSYPPALHDHDLGNPQVPPQTMTSAVVVGSRPLPPEPQVRFSQPPPQASHPLPVPPTPANTTPASFSQPATSQYPSQSNNYPPQNVQQHPFPSIGEHFFIPPPPPPPLPPPQGQYVPEQQQYLQSTPHITVPPPPPPPSLQKGVISHRRASLPQPPVTYQQPPIPPPPPPTDVVHHVPNQHSGNQNHTYHSNHLPQPPLPPPPPPPLVHATEHSQWVNSNSKVLIQDSYQSYP